jgi:hypothetical protein
MQQQLKKDHHIIAHFYQEIRDLKGKLIENTHEAKTPLSKVGRMQEMSKGRKIRKIHETLVAS